MSSQLITKTTRKEAARTAEGIMAPRGPCREEKCRALRSIPVWFGVLVGELNNLEKMAYRFRQREGEVSGADFRVGLMIIAVVTLIIFGVALASKHYETRRARPRPVSLFLSLCRAHRLSWRESWLLWRIGWSRGLPELSSVFLDREALEGALPIPKFRRHARSIECLIEDLFAESSDEAPPAVGSPKPTPDKGKGSVSVETPSTGLADPPLETKVPNVSKEDPTPLSSLAEAPWPPTTWGDAPWPPASNDGVETPSSSPS